MVALRAFTGLLPDRDALVRSVDGSERAAQRIARRAQHARHVAWLEGSEEGRSASIDDWIADGSLRVDPHPTLRVIEQRLLDGRRVVGLLGLADLADLVPHEGTDANAVRRRVSRDRQQEVDSRPLLAVLPADPPGVVSLIADITGREPELDICDEEGVTHRTFTCTEDEAADITALVRDVPCLLADGHHRAAASLLLGRTAVPTLVALATWSPRMLPVWRVGAITRASAAAVHGWMDTLPGTGDIEVHFDGRVRRAPTDGLELPVTATQRYAESVPGIQRVTSTSDLAAVAVAQRDGAVVVGSNPPTVTDVLSAVAAGRPLPPKSTAFYPKPRVGLVLHRVTDDR